MQGVRPRVFMSYTHHGGRELAEDIETELRLRGVEVWRDVRSADLGMGIRETAEKVMADPRTIACLILFTEKTRERPSVKHEAWVAFNEAWKRPEFKVIPVTTGSFEDLERVLNASEFPPVWRGLGTAVPPEEPARMRAIQGLARGVLGHVLGHCFPVEAGSVTIQLNTRDGTDPAPEYLLFLDWRPLFPGDRPPDQATWEARILPALADLKRALAGYRHLTFSIVGFAHLCAAFALGYTLGRTAGYQHRLGVVQHPVDWRCEPQDLEPGGLDIEWSGPQRAPSLVACASLANEVALERLDPRLLGEARILVAQPVDGPSRKSVPDGRALWAMATHLADHIRSAQPLAGSVTHVFMAVPFAFAVALGHLSNAAGRFVLYDYRESEGTYIHAVELRRELLAAAPVV